MPPSLLFFFFWYWSFKVLTDMQQKDSQILSCSAAFAAGLGKKFLGTTKCSAPKEVREKINWDRTLPNSFSEWISFGVITLIPRPNSPQENYKPIPLMNIKAKIFDKILANWIQQHIKKIIYHNQMGFISWIQGCFNITKSINVTYHINKANVEGIMWPSQWRKSICL